MNLEDLKKILLNKEKQLNFSDISSKAKDEQKEKITLIKNLFENENCFFDIDMKLAIDILWFLGISKDSLLDVYYELTSPINYKKEHIIELIDLNKM